MESKRGKIAKTTLRKKDEVGGVPLPVLSLLQREYQGRSVMAERQTTGSVEPNRGFRDKPAQMCSTECCQRCNSSSVKEEESF